MLGYPLHRSVEGGVLFSKGDDFDFFFLLVYRKSFWSEIWPCSLVEGVGAL